jgi:hypothetical protein
LWVIGDPRLLEEVGDLAVRDGDFNR